MNDTHSKVRDATPNAGVGVGMASLSPTEYLGGLRGALAVVAGLGLVTLIAVLDYETGPYLSFGIFYLIPVAACAWYGGFPHGTLQALAASIAWNTVDALESPLLPDSVGLWNGVTRFATLALASSLVARLHAGMRRERLLARTDALTGAANARTFYEAVAAEAARAGRASRPLTLAYLDLDNFKQLNDRLGHAAGDAALVHVVRTTHVNLRGTDLLARLGGDEFGLLLPETGDDSAVALLTRVQELLAEEMARRGWPVTLSVGAVTFQRPASWDVDVMVQRVDALMYQAKKHGKARIAHAAEAAGPPAADDGARAERRARGRVLCNRPATARPEGEDSEMLVTVRDLSISGVGLFVDVQFPAGTVLVVEPLGDGPRTLLARVVHARPDSGGWLHGCELPTDLSDADLRRWLERKAAQSEPL
jgi:diguanylate cyclase (GGDEF)-like protein